MAYALTIFISAFLLFLVQLIIGKRILPWFGGAPAVWTSCMLFFQLLLLAGYTYAHFLTARFSNSVQAKIHGTMLLASSLLLSFLWWQWGTPILPNESWKPLSPDQPIWQILKLLTVSVGLPFFILSSTSPLLQRWYSFKGDSQRTYRLYALSNIGSMLALLSYPFVIEPVSRLSTQGNSWGVLYFVFVIGCLACGVKLPKSGPLAATDQAGELNYKRPGWITLLLWLFLAASTSAMLLAVTNSLCQEVAVVPFLWVLPLSIYLLTFIICFDSPRWYHRRWFLISTAASSVVVLITAFRGLQLGILPHIVSYGIFLFLFCMTCHGELVRLKPATQYLTQFYLMIALGGAIGGIFVGVLAPGIFKGYWEFYFVLLAGWVLLAIVLARDKTSPFHRGDKVHLYLILLFFGYLIGQVIILTITPEVMFSIYLIPTSLVFALIAVALFAVVTRKASFVHSKYWPRLLVGIVIFVAECFLLHRVRSADPMTLRVDRNFYGVTKISRRIVPSEPPSQMLQLTHGQITHGSQFLDGEWHNQPIGYYSKESGIGLAFQYHSRRSPQSDPAQPMNVGLLGLGVGTLASYARENDSFRFYEINPTVAAYSLGEKPFFSYLKNAVGKVDIVMGDARLSLERELQNPNAFDLLVMDVFSSDSVPVHLLTSEAFEIYLGHLRDDRSIIAVHISNRFLHLQDLVANTGRKFGLRMVLIDEQATSPGSTASLWCLLTRDPTFLNHPEVQKVNLGGEPANDLIWSDDYSNLFRLLK